MKKEDFIREISMPGEVWENVVGLEDKYIVSSFGRIVSFAQRMPRLLALCNQTSRGKTYVHVCIGGKKRRVHQLVATAFIDNPLVLSEIDHINNDGTDNRVSNLRWCTHKSNMRNPLTKEVQREYRISHPILSDISGRRMSDYFFNLHEDEMKAVVQLKGGEIVSIHKSIGEASKCGFSKSAISQVCHRKRRSHKGYEWVFLADHERASGNC